MHRTLSGRPAWGGILAGLLMMILIGPSVARAADEITGQWEATQDFYGQKSYSTLTIDRLSSGSLAGQWNGRDVNNLKFDNGQLTFDRDIPEGGDGASLSYAGELKDGKISGAIKGDFGSFPTNLARPKPLSPALGVYPVRFKVGDRDVADTITLTQDNEGILKGFVEVEGGQRIEAEAKYDDGKLTMRRKGPGPAEEGNAVFEGELKDGKLTGTLKADGRSDIAISGERYGQQVIGRWELTGDFDLPPHTRALIIRPDLTARYQQFGGVVDLDSLSFSGDTLDFAVKIVAGGTSGSIAFHGRVAGDTLNGKISGYQGVTEVTGKKIASPK